MKLDDLPRYVEAPQSAMWRLPADFKVTDSENVFVKLEDVEKLLTHFQQALQDIIESEEAQSVQSYGLGDIARKALELCQKNQD